MSHVIRLAFQKRLFLWLLLEDIVDWVLFTLSATFFIEANIVEKLSSTTRTLFSSNLPMMWCKSVRFVHDRDSVRAIWLVLRGNMRFLQSFIIWHVAMNRRSITFLYNYLVNSLKVDYRGPAETTKTSGRWKDKISLLSQFCNLFHTNEIFFPSFLPKSVYQVPLGKYIKSCHRKLAKH